MNDIDNEWSRWGAEINKEVDETLHEIGDRDNAHYYPALAKRLLQDINIFPLWSNVCHDDFGYGRVPASSASVEGEFNKIKNCVLKNYNLPIRADEFIKIHLDYLYGKLKIVNAEEELIVPHDELSIKKYSIENEDKITQNIPPPNEQQKNIKSCSACTNGMVPSGAHTCAICKVAVHALEECSLSYGEEGYGQKRICLSCSSMEDSQKILAAQETENWGGVILDTNEKRKTRYLGENQRHIQDALTFKNTKLPIIKNGNSTELQSIKIDNQNYCVINTCGFDSLLQIVLAILSDHKEFETKVYIYIHTYTLKEKIFIK